ncbi:MAG TPA: nuclear transport factor 2 family protein [Streptosporangiaceae bacterium]|jgi:SnoaL-like domain|nr:nuclear transport factor 2 family protein [Streptosporangiaceae bacterium]
MSAQHESPAVAIARAHVEAWSKHDFDTARGMLAPDVRVRVTTTAPYPPDTDLTGADTYMEGLHAYAEPIVPGSVKVLASTGDDHSALLLLSLTMAGGPFGEGTTAPCARLYLIDDNGKIKTEQVVFYLAQA